MALDINSYNATFKAFADFAKVSEAKGDKSAIARIAKGVDVASGPLEGRSVVAASSDSVRGSPSTRTSCKWRRKRQSGNRSLSTWASNIGG